MIDNRYNHRSPRRRHKSVGEQNKENLAAHKNAAQLAFATNEPIPRVASKGSSRVEIPADQGPKITGQPRLIDTEPPAEGRSFVALDSMESPAPSHPPGGYCIVTPMFGGGTFERMVQND